MLFGRFTIYDFGASFISGVIRRVCKMRDPIFINIFIDLLCWAFGVKAQENRQ